MKNAVILLSILCALFAGAWFMRNSQANQQEAASLAALQTLSNKVAEVQTRLVMNQAKASDAQGLLQTNLTQRLAELAGLSNHLARTAASLAATQKELQAAHSEAATRAVRVTELEGQNDALARQVASLAPLEKQLADVRQQVAAVASERVAALQECGRLQVEKAEVLRKLEDPAFLRRQSAQVEQETKLATALAKQKPSASASRLARLELQPDGTVRLVTNAPAAKAAQHPDDIGGSFKTR
ncbi:MAG: hypothetical protein HZA90_23965 [Verrucomicrobia bacterium]|nr:hypothetical protein [Verrucomicrobiota bacterium]